MIAMVELSAGCLRHVDLNAAAAALDLVSQRRWTDGYFLGRRWAGMFVVVCVTVEYRTFM